MCVWALWVSAVSSCVSGKPVSVWLALDPNTQPQWICSSDVITILSYSRKCCYILYIMFEFFSPVLNTSLCQWSCRGARGVWRCTSEVFVECGGARGVWRCTSEVLVEWGGAPRQRCLSRHASSSLSSVSDSSRTENQYNTGDAIMYSCIHNFITEKNC